MSDTYRKRGEEILDPQPVPDARCYKCGGEPTEQSQARHKLSVLDYLHDDVLLECQDCDNRWQHGIPIGEHDSELADELDCDNCGEHVRVHRVDVSYVQDDRVDLHTKCPECYYFKVVKRNPNATGIVLIGHRDTTGSFEDSEEWASRE